MSSSFHSLRYKSLIKDTFITWREEEEDLVIVTKSGQKVSAQSKILAFHSSLVAALLENLKHGEKATISVDSTKEDVSTLLNLLNTGESSLENGCMLGEVCGLANSLGINLQGVTVLNNSLSYQYDESYLLLENEDEPDIIEYIKDKEPGYESDVEWKPKPFRKKENNLTYHTYRYDTLYLLQETKDEPDVFEYIEVKKHRKATVAPNEHKVTIKKVNVPSIKEEQIVAPNKQETSIQIVNVLSIEGKKHEDKMYDPSKHKSRTKYVSVLDISEKKQDEEIVAPSQHESRTQNVNVLNIEINKTEKVNDASADCKSKVQDANILITEVKKHENKIVASTEHEPRIENVNFRSALPCEYDTSYLLQENEEEPDINKYMNKKENEIKTVASTKPNHLVQHPNVLKSPSYEYDASYILQETEEEPDIIEFIKETENKEKTVETQKFVKSYTLPVNFNPKVKDEQHLLQLNLKRNHSKESLVIETKECFFCPKTFKSKNKLKFHTMCRLHRSQLEQAAHTGYSCNFCKEVFHFTSLLKRHITNTHKEVMQYLCIKCSVIFNSASDIKDHIKCNYSGYLSQ